MHVLSFWGKWSRKTITCARVDSENHSRLSMPCVWRRVELSFSRLAHHQKRSIGSKATSVVLRPYQEACLDACTQALESGVSRIGVSLPTGSGKTTVFISLLSRIHPPKLNPHARRSLVIVNSIELARQTANQVKTLFPNWSVEIEQGVKHKASGFADVYVRSRDIQSLSFANKIRHSETEPSQPTRRSSKLTGSPNLTRRILRLSSLMKLTTQQLHRM
jgi:superfamily II DNA or RNA helicase